MIKTLNRGKLYGIFLRRDDGIFGFSELPGYDHLVPVYNRFYVFVEYDYGLDGRFKITAEEAALSCLKTIRKKHPEAFVARIHSKKCPVEMTKWGVFRKELNNVQRRNAHYIIK